MLKIVLWGLVVLVAAGGIAFVTIGRERSWELIAGPPGLEPYDFNATLRSPNPNDALACSPGLCQKPDFEIAPMHDAPPIVIERLSQRLLASDSLARRVDDRKDPDKARFVTYSPFFRFPDVIHLEARPLQDGRTGVMAYARAQLGKSDLGKNRARLEALFAGP